MMDEPLGSFFTSGLIENSIMTPLVELLAATGVCPNCKTRNLRHISQGGGVGFRQCAECKTIVVLSDG